MARRIVIVGGGITGLAAAFELERTTDAAIDLYEASDRLGGKLRTEHVGDLLIEHGPDCFFSRKPGALELVRDLGLEGELIEPEAGEFGMLVKGVLHRVPRGLVALNAPDPDAIRNAPFLSEEGKARALDPQDVPEPDPSIRAFFTARYGAEFSRLVAEPLLAGTHGGDPGRLSMKALYPAYLNPSPAKSPVDSPASEAVTPASPRAGATFLSFREGMRTLVDGLEAALRRTHIHLGRPTEALPRADRVLLAIPSNRAASLLPNVGLETIAHRSSAIVTLAFRRADVGLSLDGTGFLVPPSESSSITGATWSSAKWSHRAPDDQVLLRVFLRGADDFMPPLRELLGLQGEPLLRQTDRWTDALPQYEVGHLDRIDEIERRLPDNVFLAGTSYRGVGVPDCLRQGRDIARRIAQTL